MFADTAYATVPPFADSEARHMCLLSADQTVPTTLRVPQRAIHGQVPWFLTQADATDASLETQGSFLFGAGTSSSEVITFLVHVRCEFKTLLDPSIITMRSSQLKHSDQTHASLDSPDLKDDEKEEDFSIEEIALLRKLRDARKRGDTS
jgi:hypothetical protein